MFRGHLAQSRSLSFWISSPLLRPACLRQFLAFLRIRVHSFSLSAKNSSSTSSAATVQRSLGDNLEIKSFLKKTLRLKRAFSCQSPSADWKAISSLKEGLVWPFWPFCVAVASTTASNFTSYILDGKAWPPRGIESVTIWSVSNESLPRLIDSI